MSLNKTRAQNPNINQLIFNMLYENLKKKLVLTQEDSITPYLIWHKTFQIYTS